MPWLLSDALRFDRRGPGFCGALAIGQVGFLACLLRVSVGASVLFALLAGPPLALACYGLLARAGVHRRVHLTVVMFTAGGFGMLLGCLMD